MELRFRWLFILPLLFSIGCSTISRVEEAVADQEQGSEFTERFDLTASQAESVVLDAMRTGWPSKTPVRTSAEPISYEITLHFAIDRERIIVRALPTDGGYRFQVINRGTAPVVGVPAREKLVASLAGRAAALATAP